jgi:hypothetical protein
VSDNNNKKKLDPSTLNFNKTEEPGSQKMAQNRFYKNLHVKQSIRELDNMIVPRGFDLKVHGFDVHKNHLAEGCLVTVFCNNINPNELCRREEEELSAFITNKLKVIRDNPYELKGVNVGNTKLITEIDNEEKAQKAFNLVKQDKRVLGQL